MKCKLLRPMDSDPPEKYPDGKAPVGTIIDHSDAYLLVRQGVAEPADEECEKAHGMTPEQLERARYGYERADKGIHPDDYAAYDAGQMVGYGPDGRPIPGPNYIEEDECEEEEEEFANAD